MRLGETPVPIPNTMVKTQAADGTILETIWESRWLPERTPDKREVGGSSPLKPSEWSLYNIDFTLDICTLKTEY